ncbi:MAG: M14 family zinc carboxypeptidase [Bacteroidota bacterium]
MKSSTLLGAALFAFCEITFSQHHLFIDPCGFPDTTTWGYLSAASGNWGYGYDTLLYDLAEWKKSPFVTVDSVGTSVQHRTLFVVTIQDTTVDSASTRQRIWIHARTHPAEVQGTWVTNEMIKLLLSSTPLAQSLRQRYVFNIMPMYNPDGVELGKPRQNANGIDLESNWNATTPQQEVLVLRSQFERMMLLPNPMRIMLNMHSSTSCKRYFVYHAAGGTSEVYAQLEQQFINHVRKYFPGGIEPYTYFVSWTNAPATQYPESWCWFNYKEKILAITYEDMNCTAAGAFDSTAYALLKGMDDFLQEPTVVNVQGAFTFVPRETNLEQNYPNPFNPNTTISFTLHTSGFVSLNVFDIVGRKVVSLVNEWKDRGRHEVRFNAETLAGGVYFYQLRTASATITNKMVLAK